MICTFPSLKIDIEQYPAVKGFLEGFKAKLKQTGEILSKSEINNIIGYAKNHNIEVKEKDLLTSRKKTKNKWFETQDSINYWEDFSKQKIVYPNMTKYMPFLLDNEGFCTNQKCFIVTGESLPYLTAFFNSNIFKICYRDNFPELLGGTRELSKVFFEQVKIPNIQEIEKIDFETFVEDVQKGEDNASLRLERALMLALDLQEYEEYILSYNINSL